MKAVAIESYGGKEMLKLRELPIPEMSPAEVLIKVEAAGVGVWDAIVRQGFMEEMVPATFPLVLGGDGSGTIAAVGADVQGFRVGDKVYGYAFLSPKGKGGDLAAAIHRFAPEGLDAVLATVNGKGLDTAITAIRQGGRLAYPNGVQPEPKAGHGVAAVNYSGTPDRQTFDRLNALIEAGPFSVQIDQRFPLSEAVQAQAAMEEHHLGRMVLLTAH